MKRTHRPDMLLWSRFDEDRNVDFNSVVWVREAGNVLVDPLPLSAHDEAHLDALGGAAWIVVTNSDHVRAAAEIAARTGASIAGPRGERGAFPIGCDRWLGEGDELVPGLLALEIHGSKTPGELAVVIEQSTLVTGDVIRGDRGGSLNLLPRSKLADPAAVDVSLFQLMRFKDIEAVLVGDGWPVFRRGYAYLEELARG